MRLCQSLIGKVQRGRICYECLEQNILVSIPHREGTTTALTLFVIAIIPQNRYFAMLFRKKSVDF